MKTKSVMTFVEAKELKSKISGTPYLQLKFTDCSGEYKFNMMPSLKYVITFEEVEYAGIMHHQVLRIDALKMGLLKDGSMRNESVAEE